MKAVILAAGKSTRAYPLTLTRPKPLLKVANRTILEHNLEALQGLADEVIIVVGFMKEKIMEAFGTKYKNLKLTYVVQKEQLGTGDAVRQVEPFIKDRFLLLMGDDLYDADELKQCLGHKQSILCKEVKDIKAFGALKVKANKLVEIVEKPEQFVSNLSNCGCYVLGKDFFKCLRKLKKTSRGEYEVTDAISSYAGDHDIILVKTANWIPLPYPWSLLDANSYLLSKIRRKIEGTIEANVTIKGEVVIGKGTIVKSSSYLEGPIIIGKNCEIGPMAHIRPDTFIDDNCRIGKTEVVDCIIMANTTAKHFGYLGHSVIGENCNIGAGTITADYRHDGKSHMTVVNSQKVDSGRRKLGAFLGDNAKTAINTSIYPGRKIWPNLGTLPGEIVTADKVE